MTGSEEVSESSESDEGSDEPDENLNDEEDFER
jgi:hypothetical protein